MDRLIIVEALDPLGNKVCDLYDSTCSFPGQITNIKIQYDKKELTTLSFTLPTKIVDAETGALIDNPRWEYMNNEYQIRYSEDGVEDIFIIKSPEETNTGVKITETITCLHRATRLKNRNLAVSRDSFVGNARSHLERILENTGWTCGKVDEFYEDTLYEKYFDVDGGLMFAPSDASYGAYAEIRRATGASNFNEIVGWKTAEIIVTSLGKNLCDGMIERGGISRETGLPSDNDTNASYRSINYLYVKPFRGTTLVMSGDEVYDVIWFMYDENKNLISSFQNEINRMTLTFESESECAYIKYQILAGPTGTETFTSPPANVQIEVGLTPTAFTDYTTPYSLSFTLGEYDKIDRNRVIRKTKYEGSTVAETANETIEYIPVYSIKMYEDGWIYAENKGVGGVDATFAYTVTPDIGGALREKYRYVGKESGTSVYQEIMDLEETFGGRAVFHGDTMTVDFLRFIGRDTHFAFKPKYNIKSIKRTRSSNELITRLYVIDQQSEAGYIGIEDVNPLGTNFIMNFDHFDLTEKQQEAIDFFTERMKSIQYVTKIRSDEYIRKSNLLNEMVGQTPMGIADVIRVEGNYVYIDESTVCSYQNRARPQPGDIVYIKNSGGIWIKHEVDAYYSGINAIHLTDTASGGSTVWWMANIPAGTVGAQVITLNTYYERRSNYEAQLEAIRDKGELTEDDEAKIEEIKEKIRETVIKINEVSNGTLTSPGLGSSVSSLIVYIQNYNDVLEFLESYALKRSQELTRLDDELGDIVYEGVFPQGEYASGQEVELYEDALKYLNEHCHPQAEYSVTAIDRTAYGDTYDIENIRFGDIVYIDDDELKIFNLPAEITSYTDEPLKTASNSFTLGNFAQNPIEMFEQIIDASKTIADSKYKYGKLISLIDADGTISKDILEKSMGEIPLATKAEIEQIVMSCLTTDNINKAGINWSQVGMLNDEISIQADKTTSGVLAADVITSDRIAAGAIQAYHIQSDSIDANHIKAESIDSSKIAAGSITGDNIKAKSISAAQLRAGIISADSGLVNLGAIKTAHIADAAITAAKVSSLNADVITSGTLRTKRLLLVGKGGVVYEINAASSGLTQTELTDEKYQNYINGTVIVAKSVTADQIAARTITGTEILANSITSAEINVAELFANEATIAELNTVDIRGNQYLQMAVMDVEVGGRNLIRNSRGMVFEEYKFDASNTVAILGSGTLDRMVLGG